MFSLVKINFLYIIYYIKKSVNSIIAIRVFKFNNGYWNFDMPTNGNCQRGFGLNLSRENDLIG